MLLALTGLINFSTCIILGFLVLFRKNKTRLNKIYFYFNINIAIYNLGYFFWHISASKENAIIWSKIYLSGVILLNVIFLHFIFEFLNKTYTRRKELFIYYALSIIFIFLNISFTIFSNFEQKGDYGFWPTSSIPTIFYSVFWLWQVIYAFSWLKKGIIETKGSKKEQLKYFMLATIIGYLGSSTNWFIVYNIKIPPYSNILISFYVAIIAYAIIKHGFLDIKIVLSRATIFLLVYLLVLGVPFWIGYKTDYSLLSFILLFFLASIGPIIYRYLQNKAENILLAEQKFHQSLLHRAGKRFVKEHNLKKLLPLIVKEIKKAMDIDFAELFLIDKTTNNYKFYPTQRNNFFPKNYFFSKDHALIKILNKKGKPIFFEEVRSKIEFDKPIPASLIIPTILDEDLLGFLLLGDKKNGKAYSKDDLATFETLANQAALAIQNSFIMEENKLAQEKVFQTEKLSFIGGMAEGVAHRIRNRLSYFTLASAEIQLDIDDYVKENSDSLKKNKDLKKTFSSLKKISSSLIDNVKRTDAVIKGILTYSEVTQKKSNSLTDVSFNEIADAAVDLARIKHEVDKIPVNIEIDSSNFLYGNKIQLLETLYTLIDNSYEALNELKEKKQAPSKKAAPFIKLSLTQEKDYSLIKIEDNGIGIKTKDQNKIFAPFFSTKTSFKTPSETGVGLYTIQKIITEEHQGKLWFESKELKGTTFYIKLPLKNSSEIQSAKE